MVGLGERGDMCGGDLGIVRREFVGDIELVACVCVAGEELAD